MQAKRMYVFIDAENHFHRSVAAARDTVESQYAPEAFTWTQHIPGNSGFPHDIEGKRYGWNPELQLFWDCNLLSQGGMISQLGAQIQQACYVCACTGDEETAHAMRVKLRRYQFDPIVVRESKSLQKKRKRKLEQDGLIEKAKGCDIALATRMVADAAADLYDCCILFTSDADFMPAVEAVRRMGKVVWVFGYKRALAKRSPYLHAPDRFFDLEERLKSEWHNWYGQIKKGLQKLGETKDIPHPKKQAT